jgi:1-acyl-sn-glycerol-3-phosphate acyltransferase
MWYWMWRGIFIFIFKVFFRLKVEGLENLPKSNFIIISNHYSFLDAPVYVAGIPRKVHCMVSPFLYNILFIKWFLWMVEAVPIGKSSDKAVELLMHNEIIGMYPEGRVSRDGTLGEFRRGAALLAYKTGRPILPCAVLGTYEALPITRNSLRFARIRIKVGKPVYVPKEFDEWIDDVYLQEVTLKVRGVVQELLGAG